ncbi:MAG: hypothetical protein QXM78_01225 [Sulfolobales archaeon]
MQLLVDPRITSKTCPYVAQSMVGYAQRSGWKPRYVKCEKYVFIRYRDVTRAWKTALRPGVSPDRWA